MMSDNQQRTRWLGRAGEEFLRSACNDSGLTATKPEHEDYGWDFLIEMPQSKLPTLMLDAQPAPIKLLCQVKATDDFTSLKIRMEVSTFEHLARTPLPSFVLIVDYQGQKRPRSVYLCHFGPERVGQTLKRIRELQSTGKLQLNRHSMTLTAKSDELVDTDLHKWFLGVLLKETGSNLSEYVRMKSDWVERLGFEDGRYRLKTNIRMRIEEVVDAHLGLRDIEISGGSISSIRFGVEIKEQELSSGRLQIEVKPFGQCRIVASSRLMGLSTEFEAPFKLPAIPNLPKPYFKVLIKNNFIEMIISENGANIKYKFDPDVNSTLGELIKSLEFIEICKNDDVKIQIYDGNNQIASFNVPRGKSRVISLRGLLDNLRVLRRFLDFVGWRDDIPLNCTAILEQEENLKWMNLALSPKGMNFFVRLDGSVKINQSKEGIAASLISFKTRDECYVAFCYWAAKFNLKGSSLRVNVRDCKVWEKIRIKSEDDAEILKRFNSDFKSFCSDLGKGTLFFREIEESDDFA